MIWLSLVACVGPEEAAASMEDALATANDALAVSLVATEIRSQVDAPPSTTRHATTCGCPCRTRTGDGDPYVLTLDYHPEGCLPTSGLVAGGLSGTIVLEVDGDAVVANLTGGGVGGAPLSGTLRGDVAGRIASSGAVGIGDRSFDLAIGATWDGATYGVAGDVEVDGTPVGLAKVVVSAAGLADVCPTPDRGTATVRGDHEVEIAWGAPEPGLATATLGGRESAPTDPCDFASRLY